MITVTRVNGAIKTKLDVNIDQIVSVEDAPAGGAMGTGALLNTGGIQLTSIAETREQVRTLIKAARQARAALTMPTQQITGPGFDPAVLEKLASTITTAVTEATLANIVVQVELTPKVTGVNLAARGG